MTNKLKIGVVGGSISGCTAGVLLSRAGHDVTVYERSRGELKGRGAGIGTPVSVIQALIERDLIDADMPYFSVNHVPFVTRTSGSEPLGYTPWLVPFKLELLNWGDLYRNLRKRVPDDIYRQGRQVVAAEANPDRTVTLRFRDGEEATFDLVVFADGYHSLGRELVCDQSLLSYRGYVLWRGVLPEQFLDDSGPLEGQLHRVRYPDGHGVFYFVPGAGGSVTKGERWVNWAIYVRVPEDELAAFLVDRDGRAHDGSIPPGMMPLELEARLKALIRDQFPPYHAAIVDRSQETFAQAIYTAEVSGYSRGRMCLMGDAGAVAQPFTAGGVFKGMNNAIDLTDALAAGEDIDEALVGWAVAEAATGKRLSALGRQLEKALIFEIPDFNQMDEAAVRAWWQAAAKPPEDIFGGEDE